MMQRVLHITVLLLLSLAVATAQQRMVTPEVRAAMQALSVDTLLRHAAWLADDVRQGRGTGSEGTRAAAQYLAAQLERLGVVPAMDADGYHQTFPLHGSMPLEESRLLLHTPDGEEELRLWDDYLLYKTGAQTFIPRPVRLMFVGYGIIAPEYDYNDYQNIDVTDAIVVYLSGEPLSADADYFEGPTSTVYSIPEMKQRIAFSRGARGSIMLPLPRVDRGYTWENWKRIFSFEDVTLPITVPSHLSALMSLEAAVRLFDGADWSLADVLEMDERNRIRSFPLYMELSFAGSFRERDFLTSNVIGMLPGSDPLLQDSWVIVSAHYDHLGIGPPMQGDSIYNGFVDNALGCAALLEFARIFSHEKWRPKRSILFLFTAAEEKGLLGSQYYCAHPVAPLYKTIANLNVDGLAILDEFDDVIGVGAEYSTLHMHLQRLAGELDLRVSALPPDFTLLDAFAASDQISFAQAGIPSILVMEGNAYRHLGSAEGYRRFIAWGRERYHTPFDDAGQPVHRAALLQHTRILTAFLAGLANTFEPPQWLRGSRYINARLQSLAEER
ncbi:MAG: M20/M25/M40 family metallo-hydrolase [Bacteroidetes bacterium]|nr:M20/M25/M40 family metallo-hydrolase [Bacteroidota bacterium]